MGYVIELISGNPEKMVFLDAGRDCHNNRYAVLAQQLGQSPNVTVHVYAHEHLMWLNTTRGAKDRRANWSFYAGAYVDAESRVARAVELPFVIGSDSTVRHGPGDELIATIPSGFKNRIAMCPVLGANEHYRGQVFVPKLDPQPAAAAMFTDHRIFRIEIPPVEIPVRLLSPRAGARPAVNPVALTGG